MTARGRWAWIALVTALGALIVGRWLAVTMAEHWWAEALGVGRAHWTIARSRIGLSVVGFAIAWAWCTGHLFLVYRAIGSVHVSRRLGNIEILEAMPRRYLAVGGVVLGLVLAVTMSLDVGDWWPARLLATGEWTTGLTDPLLERDLAFYLYQLPWLRHLHSFATLLCGVMLGVVALLYGAIGALRWAQRRLHVNELARAHLGFLLGALGLTLFWGYRLEPAEYLAAVHGVPYDSVLIDIRLPVAKVLAALALIATVMSLLWLWIPRLPLVAAGWAVLVLSSLVGHYLVPGFAGASRDDAGQTAPQLAQGRRDLLSTAFGHLDSLAVPVLPSQPGDSLAVLAAELRAAPLWDAFALQVFLDEAVASSPDRFTRPSLSLYRDTSGVEIPVYLSTRTVDLVAARREADGLSWEAVHTGPLAAGQGAVAMSSWGVAPTGAPLFVPDLRRPRTVVPTPADLRLGGAPNRFGAHTTEYAIVQAFGDSVVGVTLGGVVRRLALAWALQSQRLAFSGELRASDRVLWRRSVRDRLDAYAPFARFGDPYPVVVEGRLVWLANGYVWSDESALSHKLAWRDGAVAYLRSAFVGVVDAQTGATRVYLLPEPDPLSRAWADILPDLVRPADPLPPELVEHARYPSELLSVQTELVVTGGTRRRPLTPVSAVIAPEPRSQVGEILWWFGSGVGDAVPRLRTRMTVEHGDPALLLGYGEGVMVGGVPTFTFVRVAGVTAVPGPSRMAAEFERVRPAGSFVTGPIKVAALGGGIVYLQSAYVTNNDSGAPSLSQIAIGWGGLVESGATVDEALARLQVVQRPPAVVLEAWSEARRWFDRMDAARRAGDWAAFGRAYEALRKLLASERDTAR